MKGHFALLCLALLVPAAAAADIHGAWIAEKTERDSMRIELSRPHDRHGEMMKVADFTGLPSSALDAAVQTPVNFSLKRDAGTIAFEGTFRNGDGAGQFTFTPNPAFVAALRELGVTFEHGGPDDEHVMTMALTDVSSAYIRAMQAEGYRLPGEKYLELRMFGITPGYVREMREAGYPDLPVTELVAMRIQGIDAKYVKRMNALH